MGVNMKYVFAIILVVAATIAAWATASTLVPNTLSVASDADPTATPKAKAAVKTIREITFTDGEFDGTEIVKSDDEWKKLLTANEFYIMRQEGTEAAYTG